MVWLGASNAENNLDWLWMGAGKDGNDVPLNYSNWGVDEPVKKGNSITFHYHDPAFLGYEKTPLEMVFR